CTTSSIGTSPARWRHATSVSTADTASRPLPNAVRTRSPMCCEMSATSSNTVRLVSEAVAIWYTVTGRALPSDSVSRQARATESCTSHVESGAVSEGPCAEAPDAEASRNAMPSGTGQRARRADVAPLGQCALRDMTFLLTTVARQRML